MKHGLYFLLPTAIAFVGSVYYVLFTEEDWKWKVLAAGTVLASFALQFIPALEVHFAVPLVMQALVAVWMVTYWKLNR